MCIWCTLMRDMMAKHEHTHFGSAPFLPAEVSNMIVYRCVRAGLIENKSSWMVPVAPAANPNDVTLIMNFYRMCSPYEAKAATAFLERWEDHYN